MAEYRYLILQINQERDVKRTKFMGSDSKFSCLVKGKGRALPKADLGLYDIVYAGVIFTDNAKAALEDIYTKFNNGEAHPIDHYGHSVSVSDIVLIYKAGCKKQELYFCDSVGWIKVKQADLAVAPRGLEPSEKKRHLLKRAEMVNRSIHNPMYPLSNAEIHEGMQLRDKLRLAADAILIPCSASRCEVTHGRCQNCIAVRKDA